MPVLSSNGRLPATIRARIPAAPPEPVRISSAIRFRYDQATTDGSLDDGASQRVLAGPFRCCRKAQHLLWDGTVQGREANYPRAALRQCACLVKSHDADLAEFFHLRTRFYDHVVPRGVPNGCHRAVGVANTRAHGQTTTSTVTDRTSSPVIKYVATAIRKVMGTRIRAYRLATL